MKLGRIGALSFALCVVGGSVEAALPKPVVMVDRVKTSQSKGSYGFRKTKHNKVKSGTRWHQTLGRTPVVLSPYVRGR